MDTPLTDLQRVIFFYIKTFIFIVDFYRLIFYFILFLGRRINKERNDYDAEL